MYPAAKGDMMAVVIVAFVFGLTTTSTMLGIVLASSYGPAKLPLGNSSLRGCNKVFGTIIS